MFSIEDCCRGWEITNASKHADACWKGKVTAERLGVGGDGSSLSVEFDAQGAIDYKTRLEVFMTPCRACSKATRMRFQLINGGLTPCCADEDCMNVVMLHEDATRRRQI